MKFRVCVSPAGYKAVKDVKSGNDLEIYLNGGSDAFCVRIYELLIQYARNFRFICEAYLGLNAVITL